MGSESTEETSSKPSFSDGLGKWVSVISLVVGLISAAIGVFAAYIALPQDKEIKRLQVESSRIDNAVKRTDAELKTAESSRKLTLDLYQEVRKVIQSEKKNPREEEAVRVLVESLAEDPFRGKFLNVIALGANNTDVRRKAETSAVFYKEEETMNDTGTTPFLSSGSPMSPTSKYGAFNIDFFYCESSRQKNEPLAAKAAALQNSQSKGRWRARLLPESINDQPGYNIHDNIIRFNNDEKAIAQTLTTDIRTNLQVDLKGMEILYPTPNYVSVFFCAQ